MKAPIARHPTLGRVLALLAAACPGTAARADPQPLLEYGLGYQDYYYSVAPQYVTTARRAYAASAGFAATQLIPALSKRFPRCWVGTFVRYDNLSGAAFRDSPLVRTGSYRSAGVGISWTIHRSHEMVEVPR